MSVDDLRTDFHALIDEVRTDLVQMAHMVSKGVIAVTEALIKTDVQAAAVIIEQDDELDLLNLEAEDKCFQLLALQQPVAVDLRTILTDLRMISDIERSGDLVTNIAKAIGRISDVELSAKLVELIDQMGEQGKRLTDLAIGSYADKDAERAATVGEADDVLDGLHREYLEQVFDSCNKGMVTVEQAVQLAVIGRFYERIGDHAVNIAERVVFLVTGSLPEHSGAERARARRDEQQQAGQQQAGQRQAQHDSGQ